MWNGHLAFNLNPASKGGMNDSKKDSGPRFVPVLNRNHFSNHNHWRDNAKTVEEEIPGPSDA
jgi:hypothetical protein